MAINIESSAHGSAPMSINNKMVREPVLSENLLRFSLVMTFADKMLKQNILSIEEYADFSVETAQIFAVKMPQNPVISRADTPSNPRHNDGWNL